MLGLPGTEGPGNEACERGLQAPHLPPQSYQVPPSGQRAATTQEPTLAGCFMDVAHSVLTYPIVLQWENQGEKGLR